MNLIMHICSSNLLILLCVDRPIPLSLTPSEESLILDHLGIFQKNGFHFRIEQQEEQSRIYLTAIPFSKNTQFGPEGENILK